MSPGSAGSERTSTSTERFNPSAREMMFLGSRELLFAEVGVPCERVADERMVARHLLDLAVADAVAAAVADVRDLNHAGVARDVQRDERRSHALVLEPGAGDLVDVGVGFAHAHDQAARRFGETERLLCAALPGSAPSRWRLIEVLERRGRERARHLAGVVAAHAVADNEEVELGLDEKVIFVVVALSPDVGLT